MAIVIPKRPKKERDQITIRLDRDVLQMLEHYCRFLESGRDYVIGQCLTFIFRKDRPFNEWLATQGVAGTFRMNGHATAEQAQPKAQNRTTRPVAAQGRLSIPE